MRPAGIGQRNNIREGSRTGLGRNRIEQHGHTNLLSVAPLEVSPFRPP